MNRKSILADGLIGLAFASQPVFARSIEVPYHDLNLASPEGQQALDSRVRAAAREACEITAARVPLREMVTQRNCYDDALSSARKAVANVTPAHRPA